MGTVEMDEILGDVCLEAIAPLIPRIGIGCSEQIVAGL